MNKKILSAIGVGLMLGVTTSFIAMIPNTKTTNASVAVRDDSAIAEAIKMVTSSNNILNNLLEQLQIDIKNSTGMSFDKYIGILTGQKHAAVSILAGDASIDPGVLKAQGIEPGILNSGTTPATVLSNTIGKVEDIINSESYVSTSDKEYTIAKAIESSTKDSATMAQNVQHSDAELAQSVEDALKASQEAEGIMQVEQANAMIAAAEVRSIQNGNQLLAQLTAVNAQGMAAANKRDVVARRMEEIATQQLDKWVKSWSKE